jgi:hypothetical protein
VDDVTDIELSAVIFNACAGATEGFGPTLPCNNALGSGGPGGSIGRLGDGVTATSPEAIPFKSSFPYLPTPHSATEAD